MSSLRPSQIAYQSRADGGPFVDFTLYDEEGLPVSDVASAECSKVGFSDLHQLSDTTEELESWHQILSVYEDQIVIFPIHQRGESSKYGDSKYGKIKSIIITRNIEIPYRLPTTVEELEDVLSLLPNGFARDWRVGLGLLYEYRFIMEAIADTDGIYNVVVHGGNKLDEARIDQGTYYLGLGRFSDLKKSLDRLSSRHQRETRSDKELVCYTALAHAVDNVRFPERPKKLPPNVLTDLVKLGRGSPKLSKADQGAAINLVKDNIEVIAKKEPQQLLELKADIELVTLGELINSYKTLLNSVSNEEKWQKFLASNTFVLDMAFSYPVKMVCERPYVGSKSFTGQGGNYGDFLMAAESTSNVALIEIKHPQKELLTSTPYRNDTYAPSSDLSGSIAQIINQRASLQREILHLRENLDKELYAHAVPAIVITGRTPTDRHQRRSFEQYRNTLKDVSVITFDELLQRLENIYKALSPPNPLSVESQADANATEHDVPF